MPELPEVEGYRAFFDRHVLDRSVVRARALDDWMLKGIGRAAFARRLRGRVFRSTARRGKIMIAFAEARPGERDAPALALHYGMTGRPLIEAAGSAPHRWDRLVLDLDDGMQFRYRNARRLGFIRLPSRSDLSDLLWPLGPDPLEVPASWFVEALRSRRGPIKAVLLDQGFLAGIGNIYADEALFAARIRPDRPANALDAAEARRVHGAVRRVLRRAVAANLRTHHAPMAAVLPRATGAPCPNCGRPLVSATIGGRTAYSCAYCQR